MKYDVDKKLFSRALISSIAYKYDMEMAENEEDSSCTDAHREKIVRIIKSYYEKKKRSRLKLVALIVAAALLLIGCTVLAYKNNIGAFIEEFFDEYISIDFSEEDKDKTASITEVYKLSYIPDGYEQINGMVNNLSVLYEFSSHDGNRFSFEQYLISYSNLTLDNNGTDAVIMNCGACEVYMRQVNSTYHYIWNDDRYAMVIVSSDYMSVEELEKIIGGIVVTE